MYKDFGAWQVNKDPQGGKVRFSFFIPDNKVDPSQYSRGGDPMIKEIRVVGDFQQIDGGTNWDPASAPVLTKKQHSKGWVWEYTTGVDLPKGFYQYKYHVTFNEGNPRWLTDPWSRYSGDENQNSGIAVGGSFQEVNPLPTKRKEYRDLIIYEMNPYNFAIEYCRGRAILDAICDKLDYLKDNLGINAILFMPWVQWRDENFSWGYDTANYFAVNYAYTNAVGKPQEKISWLKKLINECHKREIHVIQDGVFNHVGSLDKQNFRGFSYPFFYKNIDDCPFIGEFYGKFQGLEDLNFHNLCTQEYIMSVCKYWIDEFQIDGLRLDNTTNFYHQGDTHGLPKLLGDIHDYTKADQTNFSLTIEHMDISAAEVVNNTNANSFWHNKLFECTSKFLWEWKIDSSIMQALDSHAWIGQGKVSTIYYSNHDQQDLAWMAGARDNMGSMQWYRGQPYIIALFTCPGVPMIYNGNEFGVDHWIMGDDLKTGRRVVPRPVPWRYLNDYIGDTLLKYHHKLISIRKKYAALRTDNFYPAMWENWQEEFNLQGFGVNVKRGLVIFHRWGTDDNNVLQRFIVVLNFSHKDQDVDVPFSAPGKWVDLLNDWEIHLNDCWYRGMPVGSNWGRVFYKEGL